jgi:hypothetical protein
LTDLLCERERLRFDALHLGDHESRQALDGRWAAITVEVDIHVSGRRARDLLLLVPIAPNPHGGVSALQGPLYLNLQTTRPHEEF